jgi:DNA-binding NtrC family response regulator
MHDAARILIVDDDRAFRVLTAALLREEGYEVVLASDGQEAVETLKRAPCDLVLLDLRMPEVGGMQVLEALRIWGEACPIIIVSGYGSVESAVEALHVGADDFLTKPVDPDTLSAHVAELLARRPLTDEEDTSRPAGIVGRSPAIRSVLAAIEQVAPTDTTVLVSGETGTGKELAARAIHERSARAGRPFIPVNCSSLAEGLLESELFGHVRGAFTGAVRDKPGLFEAAEGGTIFLDEIGDVSLALQQRLLRVLQEREVVRVGAVAPVPVDIRVIAATARELKEEMRAGRFREDLYYRLNVFRVEIPPLRDRRGDIPLLVETKLERLRARSPGGHRPTCSPFAMRLLQSYPWPGNVRELFAVIESSAIRSGGGRIEAQHLPPEIREARGQTATRRYRTDAAPPDERSEIVAALEASDGVRTRAAEILGMGRTTLWRKMKEYGIES